ncbi:c-type cytochrome [Halomonas binhaiensis]|uniref:C-type cytochrome n=2 Tax=Halomonas binhaiensis TaxID=2562282 RepID=A0A856QWH2_9GAMM|nr:c-type cytochrome [Halomonas binhaiensis]
MAKRLAPVGKLCVKGEECQAGVPELTAEAPATESSAGEATATSGDKQDNVATEDTAKTEDSPEASSKGTDEDASETSTDGEATASTDADESEATQEADKQPAADDAGSAEETASIDGQAIYQQTCMACHDTGIAGAPTRGDAKAWEPRLAQGIETLYDHAINGLNIMPPRGGNASLSDEEVKAAVDYMVQ